MLTLDAYIDEFLPNGLCEYHVTCRKDDNSRERITLHNAPRYMTLFELCRRIAAADPERQDAPQVEKA